MAFKISQLPAAAQANTTDLFEKTDTTAGNVSQRVSLSQIITLFGSLNPFYFTSLDVGAGATTISNAGTIVTGQIFVNSSAVTINSGINDITFSFGAGLLGPNGQASFDAGRFTTDGLGNFTAVSAQFGTGFSIWSASPFTGNYSVHIMGTNGQCYVGHLGSIVNNPEVSQDGTIVPSIAAGTGAGTGPTLTLDSAKSDMAFTVSLTTGTSPSASATIFTITFGKTYHAVPHVVFSDSSVNSAALGLSTRPYVNSVLAGSFTFTSDATGLAASTAYKWTFHVIE